MTRGIISEFVDIIDSEVVSSIRLCTVSKSEQAERILVESHKYADILSHCQQHGITLFGSNPFTKITNPEPIYLLRNNITSNYQRKNLVLGTLRERSRIDF